MFDFVLKMLDFAATKELPSNGDSVHDFLSGIERGSIVWRRCKDVGLKTTLQYDPSTLAQAAG